MKYKSSKVLLMLPIVILNCSFTNEPTIEFTICSYENTNFNSKSISYYGHTFLLIKNNDSLSLTFGYYTIPAYKTVSIGLWSGYDGSSSSSGSVGSSNAPGTSGIYYNREAYVFNYEDKMLDCYQYTFEISKSTYLNTDANNYLIRVNDSYNLTWYNCLCFVIDYLKIFTSFNLYDGIWGVATPGGVKQNMKKLFGNNIVENNNIISSLYFKKYNGVDNKLLTFYKGKLQ